MNLDDFDYPLPPELIAQEPASPRDLSRLLVLNRKNGDVFHDRFRHLPEYLRPGDTVVLNDTKVWPARLLGKKESGGKIEVLLIRKRERNSSDPAPSPSSEEEAGEWDCLIQNAGRLQPQADLFFAEDVCGEVLGRTADGFWRLRLRGKTGLDDTIGRIGYPPLPPYIRRRGREDLKEMDLDRYQTIYARKPGGGADGWVALYQRGLENWNRGSSPFTSTGVGTFFLSRRPGREPLPSRPDCPQKPPPPSTRQRTRAEGL
jgi:S-adenosylmethionine:tRNA ribosyltransferase-isomerase